MKLVRYLLIVLLIELHCADVIAATRALPPEAANSADQASLAAGEKLLRRSLNYYRDLGNFSLRFTSESWLSRDGKVVRKTHSGKVVFKRGRYLDVKMFHTKHGGHEGECVENGLDATFYYPAWRTYVKQSLQSFEQIYKQPDFGFVTDGSIGTSLIPQLTSSDPYSEFMKGLMVKSYDGIKMVDGKKCHQITLGRKDEPCDAQIFLDTGEEPWIVQFVAMRNCAMNIMSASRQFIPSQQLTMIVKFRRNRSEAKSKGARQFELPPNSKQVSHFLETSDSADNSHLLVGCAAPKLSVRTASGDKFDLSKHRGQVVVLEFWATWCAPCVQALPILENVIRVFSSKDVHFIAIDEKEAPATVSSFLKDKSISAEVGFDPKGLIGKRYRVAGIPHMVLIGRDGKIKFVHVGGGANYAELITNKLQSLLP